MKPELRKDLLTSKVGDELVVLDVESNIAHSLRPEAVAVFCALETADPIPETPEATAILLQFEERGFLSAALSAEFTRSRRQFLTDLVKAAAIPAVTTIALATPAAAQSGVTEAQCEASSGTACGQPCTEFAIGTRVCASVTGTAGGSCGCVTVPGACACT